MIGRLCSLLLLALILLQTGCKKDADVNEALTEIESFTHELVSKIDAAPNLVDGVNEAQRYLDSRKHEIKGKATMLAHVRGIQVSDETEKRMIETVRSAQMIVTSLPSKNPYMNIYMTDAIFKTKLDKLVSDYLELFQA